MYCQETVWLLTGTAASRGIVDATCLPCSVRASRVLHVVSSDQIEGRLVAQLSFGEEGSDDFGGVHAAHQITGS